MAYKGYINKAVQAMYGIPYNKLTAQQKRILHADSQRRAKLIKETQNAVLKNGLKAFEDEAKMEKVLASIYSDCQKQILADVQETLAKVQKDGGTWSYANQSALTRSKGLFEQITKELTKLGQKEQSTFYSALGNIYTDQFLRQVYTLGQSINVSANFNRLNAALVKKTLDYPWSGAMFSDRLWLDKETLGRNLRVGLTQSMILGEGIPEITARIKKGIDTSQYNAERIARTETKRVAYCAHDDVYEDTGVEYLRYRCANGGDGRVCAYCMGDNDKVYKRGEEPTLPRHPNCRCIYIPEVPDTFAPNELNELTGSVRGAENYEKWLEDNRDKINPDGSLKDGWARDWENGGVLVNTNDILKNVEKTDKDTMNRVDPMLLTDYPADFYVTKAEAKNTQALMSYVNGLEGADANTVALYRSMDKVYNFDNNNIAFKISHAKGYAVNSSYYITTQKYSEVKLVIPKLAGEDITGQVVTTLHEEMHLLDLLCSDGNVKGGFRGAWKSENTKMVEAFKNASPTMGTKVAKLFKKFDAEVDSIYADMSKKRSEGDSALHDKYFPNGMWGAGADFKGYKKALSKFNSEIDAETDYLCRNAMGGGVSALEDIYDAISGGSLRDTGVVKYGHGTTYYSNTSSKYHEALANYGALSVVRPDLIDLLAEDKPEIAEALQFTVADMLGGIK